jgi:unsaturated rhamnogalacturonyl hydrolase
MTHTGNPIALFVAVALSTTGARCGTAAEPDAFSHWPAGASPREIGSRVAENFAARQFDFQANPRREYVIYPEVCTWYGSLTVAPLIGDKDLEARLVKKFEPLLASGPSRISPEAHVDYRVFGVVPLEIYLLTRDPKYLELGRSLADKQWEKSTADGITAEARYWIDDMYMITALQMQAYRATKDVRYLDRAALTLTAYLDKLQQPGGLFYHAPDSPFFWSRGNGWVAAGMTELLRSLPENHPQRARIMDGYRRTMAALLKYQGEDGLWRQLIDRPEAWPETSGTGMFAFAMVTGVRNGWLDPTTYGPAARKAWLGLVNNLNQNANVGNVCEGTNKGSSVQYYLDRKRNTGDLHGQAPILWAASALLR